MTVLEKVRQKRATVSPLVSADDTGRRVLCKRATGVLRTSLGAAVGEKDVENAYRAALSTYFPGKTSSPLLVDGLLECDDVRSLLEFKYNWDLKRKTEQCNVLIQSLFYIKKFETLGKKLPTTIFIGDEDECFCMRADVLVKYLSHKIDWTIAPSDAKNKHIDVIQAMVDDTDILPFVFDVKGRMFDFGDVVEKIKALSSGVVLMVKITKDNVVEIFNYWRQHVLNDARYDHLTGGFGLKEVREVTARQSDIFFACLTDKDGTYLHPSKKNILVSRGENIKVNSNQYKSFFSNFSQVLSPSEMDVLVGNKDRTVEEVARRRGGEFYTPTSFTNEAHKMLDEALGTNWKDEYVVWDCASGCNNLTRDFRFKELYCSTLNQGDVDTVKDMGYNPGSTVFQYDFLNEMELGDKVPASLRKAFEQGKKVLFLINPPYGTAGNLQFDKAKKTNVGAGKTNAAMLENGMGSASQQLYAQFLFKIAKLNEKYGKINIGVFSNPIFLSGQSFASFRQFFSKWFSFKDGMVFQASNFADVSSLWGISFTLWANGGKEQSEFTVKVKRVNPDTFFIENIKTKSIYSPSETAVQWSRPSETGTKIEVPNLKSAVSASGKNKTKMVSGALGCFVCDTNIVEKNASFVTMQSLPPSNNNGKFDMLPVNFRRCIALFCARKSIMPNWINCKDEYLVPYASASSSPLHSAYESWNNDAIVYALFNNSSQQSSLRDILYKGKTWQIKNHFFYLSAKEMKDLADKHNFSELYQDVKAYGEDSFVFKQLESLSLSKDAREVLEAGRQLVRQSMAMRKVWHSDHPELHLSSWDAAHAQLKPMYKQAFKDDYKAFVALYKKFEDAMRPKVYEFGFLRA